MYLVSILSAWNDHFLVCVLTDGTAYNLVLMCFADGSALSIMRNIVFRCDKPYNRRLIVVFVHRDILIVCN